MGFDSIVNDIFNFFSFSKCSLLVYYVLSVIILYVGFASGTLINSFISSNNFLDALEIFVYTIIFSVNKNSFTSFLFFFYFNLLKFCTLEHLGQCQMEMVRTDIFALLLILGESIHYFIKNGIYCWF